MISGVSSTLLLSSVEFDSTKDISNVTGDIKYASMAGTTIISNRMYTLTEQNKVHEKAPIQAMTSAVSIYQK